MSRERGRTRSDARPTPDSLRFAYARRTGSERPARAIRDGADNDGGNPRRHSRGNSRARPPGGSRRPRAPISRSLRLTVSHAPEKRRGEAPHTRSRHPCRVIFSLSLSLFSLSQHETNARNPRISARRDVRSSVRLPYEETNARECGGKAELDRRLPTTRPSPVSLHPSPAFLSLLRAPLAFVRPRSPSLARFFLPSKLRC